MFKCIKHAWQSNYVLCPECETAIEPAREYDRASFDSWFRRLGYVEYPRFWRDILKAQEENLWEQFKATSDEYSKKSVGDGPTKLE